MHNFVTQSSVKFLKSANNLQEIKEMKKEMHLATGVYDRINISLVNNDTGILCFNSMKSN